jgi:LPS O-antigen subunit length determinant protein (WzzB/FepE family)
MPDTPKPDKPSRRAAVIMLTIIGIVVVAFVGMNLHDVLKSIR